MNCVQALAIAAAAWVVAGNVWTPRLSEARAEFELVAARSSEASREVLRAYLGKTPDGDCMLRAPTPL